MGLINDITSDEDTEIYLMSRNKLELAGIQYTKEEWYLAM
jgi:hypothetical protein